MCHIATISSFENTVAAQFFGHTHSDRFNVMYSDPNDHRSRPTGVIYCVPSVTPGGDAPFNPAYRIYTIDGVYNGSSYVS
jgi:sphingomyelin phosphodiesterase